MDIIRKYFTDLTERQWNQLAAMEALYNEWNDKINVISRKDIRHLYEHHVLHALAIAKYNPFTPGMNVLDVGTGGGFPGVPLAIYYPDVKFVLLDSTAKKIHVVREVIQTLGIDNATAIHARLEDHQGEYQILTCRAVSSLAQLTAWSKPLHARRWIVLKGGTQQEIRKELPPRFKVTSIPVNQYFEEEYFNGKYLVDIEL